MGRRSRSRSSSSDRHNRRSRRDKEGYDSSRDRRRDGNDGRRNKQGHREPELDESEERRRELRKKQERLAKLRAMNIEEEQEQASKVKLTPPTPVQKFNFLKPNPGIMAFPQPTGVGAKPSEVSKLTLLSGMPEEERYSERDKQNLEEETPETQKSKANYSHGFGLGDDDETGGLTSSNFLTEDEIRAGKELLQRNWKRKAKEDRPNNSDTEDEEDEVADVFKRTVPSSSQTQDQKNANNYLFNGISFSGGRDDSDDEAEAEVEQEKIAEAAAKGEDTLDAYMENIGTKAVKQEAFTIVSGTNKMIPREEEETITKDMVATMDDFPMSKIENYEAMDIEETQDGEDDPEAQQFIQALKDIDRFKETEEIPKKVEDEDRQSELYSHGGSNAFDDDSDEIEPGEAPADYFARKDKMAEKKVLKPVNHDEIVYEPFRKNLYIESEDVTTMSEADVEYFRKELGDIKIRGVDCPRPIRNWYQCGLSDRILKVLVEKYKFNSPFAIQCQAIPVIMSGRDCIGIAETGSGKTLAYLLPMLRHIMDQRPLAEGDGPIALVIVPTRELANQVHNDTKVFCKALGINSVCAFGGEGVSGQLSEFKRGCEICICTPGRMIDVLTTSNGKITNLRRVTYIVLDEADRMFDLGFEPQVAKIIQNARPDRQTVMFSATFPRNVETLAKKILNRPIEIVVGNRGQVGRNIFQMIEVIEPEKKFTKLLEVLGYWSTKGQVLIFVDKQLEADSLFKDLLTYGYSPLVLHGGHDQTDRQFTISEFKKGTKNILISTSVSARGLDIKNLQLVINYNCPTHKEEYTHRIGRTGRAGNKGTAYTFVTPDEDKYVGDIIQALQISNVDPPEDLLRLHERFMVKVRRGDAKEIRNRNLAGHGYRFNAEEMMADFKNTMKVTYGVDLDDDRMSVTSKAMTVKTMKTNALTNRDDDNKSIKDIRDVKDMGRVLKDPKMKDAIRKAATKAATQAITAGATSEEVLLAAQNAILEILKRLKEGEVISKNTGLDDLYRARDEMIEKDANNGGQFSQNFDINDYPESTRNRVSEREFLDMVENLTQCRLTIRGTYIEPGKKPLIGQKKLHVHIDSDEKYNLHSAIEEVKKYCEENAINSLTANGGYTGYTGRY